MRNRLPNFDKHDKRQTNYWNAYSMNKCGLKICSISKKRLLTLCIRHHASRKPRALQFQPSKHGKSVTRKKIIIQTKINNNLT